MAKSRSRRVQAQRKFAQGAYVPPNNIAVAVANDNRRDAAQDNRNVTMNPCSPTDLLDSVSFQEVHGHLQPVVMLERLRGKNLNCEPAQSRSTTERQREKDNVPNTKQQPVPPRAPLSRKRKEYKRQHLMSLRPRRLSNYNKLASAFRVSRRLAGAKRRVPTENAETTKTKKKIVALRDRQVESSEYSLDDIRPLKFIAQKSSTPARPAPVAPIVPPRAASPEPVAGPSGLQKNAGTRALSIPGTMNSRSSYYSEHNIHSWMDKSITPESRRAEEFEDADFTFMDIGLPCAVSQWQTVQDVINSTKKDLTTRCMRCKSCDGMSRLFNVSNLLKSKFKFDSAGFGDDLLNARYIDLLPKNPNFKLNLRSHMIHGKELLSVSCLTPRGDPLNSGQEFLLEEQVLLLDQLVEAIMLTEFNGDSIPPTPNNIENIYAHLNNEDEPKKLEKKRRTKGGRKGDRLKTVAQSQIKPRPKLSRLKARSIAKTIALEIRSETKQAQTARRKTSRKEAECIDSARTDAEGLDPARIEAIGIDVARKEAEGIEVARTEAEKQAEAARIEVEKNAERSLIEAEIRARLLAEVEAEVRMKIEVDEQAKALDKENDAKGSGQSLEMVINAPSGSRSLRTVEGGKLIKAPVFRPSEEEFKDPIEYFDKIWPEVFIYGICKVVPPAGWKPKNKIHDELRFTAFNQYIPRLFTRWGASARELCAIRLCLRQQKINFHAIPKVDGMDVNLPLLYRLVQRHGGLETVINRKKWGKISEEMHYNKAFDKKLEQIYMKFLLPYDTLTHQERQEIMSKVEKAWQKRNQKLMERAMNPLHRQKKMVGLSDSSSDESEDEDVSEALHEAEDCILVGSQMTRGKFRKIATSLYENIFGPGTEDAEPLPAAKVEEVYWRHVLLGADHMCVHTAAIDTGEEGYGFTKNKNEPYGKHPWNLKNLISNEGNMLRHLGPVLGLTVPIYHLGMVFSTSCWHKDPHALAWIEFQHIGPTRIWYGVPAEQEDNFRRAVEILSPTYCQNKKMWLPSDIAMIPPNILLDHNVSLSRAEQEKGEFILSFPNAYTCSISTGYTESESVYFAPRSWLKCLTRVFGLTRESCEPTMFSMEHMLLLMGKNANKEELEIIEPIYDKMLREEVTNRQILQERGLKFIHEIQSGTSTGTRRKRQTCNMRDQEECHYCRTTLFLSKVKGLVIADASFCLEHALRLLDTDKYKNMDVSSLTVYVYISIKELNSVGDDMKRRLGVYNS